MVNKPYNELTFTDDFMFGKVLTENPAICKEIAELATGRKVARIKMHAKQYTIENLRSGRGVRFDVYFEDDENTVYDIEMQTTKQKDLPRRTRYYQGLIDTHNLSRHTNYSELPNSYIIFICMQDPFSRNQYRYTFENRCIDAVGELPLGDGTRKIFLNASGTDIPGLHVSRELINFLKYVQGHPASDALTQGIEDAVQEARLDEKGLVTYMTLEEKYNEERADERAELSSFFNYLFKKGALKEAERVANDPAYRDKMFDLWKKEKK